MSIPLAWNDNFPIGYGHTSIAYLRRLSEFDDAKNGDIIAAKITVNKCVKKNRILEVQKKYPDALLLPILGQNKLPLALAQAIGMPICYDIYIVHIVYRKFLCAIQRFLHKPTFTGNVQKDVDYIIVDDIITQGGTIAALREFVQARGGNVVAVIALAYAIGSHRIAPLRRYIVQILVKFGTSIISLIQLFGIASAVKELTHSQIRYLLRFSSIGNIVKKIRQFANRIYF